MYKNQDIDTAVAAGVMSRETADAFLAHLTEADAGVSTQYPDVEKSPDEEHFRLVSSFNDIFVVIASLLVLVSVRLLGGIIHPMLGFALCAAVAWGLAEFFTRKKHMALPSIVLFFSFVGSVSVFFSLVLSANAVESSKWFVWVMFALFVFSAYMHWLRFRVPITVAAISGSVAIFVSALLKSIDSSNASINSLALFVIGLGIFALAMFWDIRDTQRKTINTDIAFWLHLLAAPLLVQAVFPMENVFAQNWASNAPMITSTQVLLAIVLYIGIGITSLAIDRRAIMASSLIYIIVLLGSYLKQSNLADSAFTVTALVIGSGLLLLSAFWKRCRALIVLRLPLGLQKYLPVIA